MKYIILVLLFANSIYAHKYNMECNRALLIKSAEIALKQVGYREITENCSPKIKQYLASVGLNCGFAYCAAGQYYCFSEAAEELNIHKSNIPISKTAVANRIYNEAKYIGEKVKYEAEKHDLIIWRRANSWSGHLERIIEVGQAGWVRTVAFNVKEGNTEGVFIKKRNIFHPLGRMTIRGLIGFSTK